MRVEWDYILLHFNVEHKCISREKKWEDCCPSVVFIVSPLPRGPFPLQFVVVFTVSFSDSRSCWHLFQQFFLLLFFLTLCLFFCLSSSSPAKIIPFHMCPTSQTTYILSPIQKSPPAGSAYRCSSNICPVYPLTSWELQVFSLVYLLTLIWVFPS